MISIRAYNHKPWLATFKGHHGKARQEQIPSNDLAREKRVHAYHTRLPYLIVGHLALVYYLAVRKTRWQSWVRELPLFSTPVSALVDRASPSLLVLASSLDGENASQVTRQKVMHKPFECVVR